MKTREQKRLEAERRNLNWHLLSTEEKIALLEKRPGKCARQLKKLLKESGR